MTRNVALIANNDALTGSKSAFGLVSFDVESSLCIGTVDSKNVVSTFYA